MRAISGYTPRNVVPIDPIGTRKTPLATALSVEAIKRGHNVGFLHPLAAGLAKLSRKPIGRCSTTRLAFGLARELPAYDGAHPSGLNRFPTVAPNKP
jgi:hypothetical protein